MLEKKLIAEKFDIDKLKHDSAYTLISVTKHREKLKAIYSSLDGNINQNSMFLYSGLEENSFLSHAVKFFRNNNYYFYNDNMNVPLGGIYTGDGNLNDCDISDIYKKYNENVGTIQIPHHGSKNNFKIDSLLPFKKARFFPISFGENNLYDHPSLENVVIKMHEYGKKPIYVTDNRLTKLILLFEICRSTLEYKLLLSNKKLSPEPGNKLITKLRNNNI